MSQTLVIWMNGARVATWTEDRGSHSLQYDPAWLTSPRRRALSLSLPMNGEAAMQGPAVRAYFDNLLPDNAAIRTRLARRFRTKADTFNLLQALGRDCIGAVQLLQPGATPDGWNRIAGTALDEAAIAAMLQAIPSDLPTADDELFRISLAGAQEKTALLYWHGQWHLPAESTPTTHILKLPLGQISMQRTRVDASDSVQNEWLCAQILAALGLPVANTTMASFGGQTVLSVERFDRAWMDGETWLARLPQEDFCQALAIGPDSKYESHGGPGMAACMSLLRGSAGTYDGMVFLLAQLAFFLLRAPDGHAKNYSLFLLPENRYTMTPLYDVMSVWPWLGTGAGQLDHHKAGLAMAVRGKNAHYRFKDIQTRHWHALAMAQGGQAVWNAMCAMAAEVAPALAQVQSRLPSNFPERTWTSIAAGTQAEAERFLRDAKAL